MPLSFLMPGGAKIGRFYVVVSGGHPSNEERLARSEYKKKTPEGVLVIYWCLFLRCGNQFEDWLMVRGYTDFLRQYCNFGSVGAYHFNIFTGNDGLVAVLG